MKEESRLYLIYSTSERGGEKRPGQENTAYPFYEDTYIDVKFTCLYRNPPTSIRFFYDSIVVEPELIKRAHLYLSVIRYSGGGTFGASHGHFYNVGLYKTHRQAEQAIKTALEGNGYKPWVGYFKQLEGEEIHLLNVED